jgi:HSP20 family protein
MNWDPFRELDDMQQRMSQLFGQVAGSGQWLTPATDVYEQGGKLVMETALPNFRDKDVQVEVNAGRLEIKAEHRDEQEHKDRNYLRRESSRASYYRQFALPEDVEADSAEARFDHGVLTITFDRKELPQPKRLQLQSGAADGKGVQ